MFPIVWDGKEFSVLHFSVTKCFFMQLLLSCNYHSPNILTWNFKTWNFLAWNFFHWKFCHLKLFVTKLCLSLNFLHWIFCPSNFLSRNFLALNLFSRNFNSQDILFTFWKHASFQLDLYLEYCSLYIWWLICFGSVFRRTLFINGEWGDFYFS